MESSPLNKQWLVAYCKPRNEKSSSERLSLAGIEVYCPMQETMRQWSDRKKKVKTPIFSSYIFVKVTEEERLSVLKDSGIVRFVFWLGKPAVVRAIEMEKLKVFLERNASSELEVTFREGDKVKLTSGPFSNEEGIVFDSNRKKSTIVLDSIGIKIIAQPGSLERIKV